MDAASIGVTEKEDDEQGIHSQDVFHCVVPFLATITVRLSSRVLGADDAPLGAVMGKRGDAGAATGAATTGAASFASGVTTEVASASETPSRCASAASERAGASPRVRRAASSAGKSTWIHWLALLWPMPNRRPCTTWRLYVFT